MDVGDEEEEPQAASAIVHTMDTKKKATTATAGRARPPLFARMSANRNLRISAPETKGVGTPDFVSSATIRRFYDCIHPRAVLEAVRGHPPPPAPAVDPRGHEGSRVRADTFVAPATTTHHPPNALSLTQG